MEAIYYNPVDEKGGCVVRSISKALNKDYDLVKNELKQINEYYNDEKVFETYLINNGFIIDEKTSGQLFINQEYKEVNIVFGYDNDWYHMFTIINNVIYDKNSLEELKNMKIIKIYKLNK